MTADPDRIAWFLSLLELLVLEWEIPKTDRFFHHVAKQHHELPTYALIDFGLRHRFPRVWLFRGRRLGLDDSLAILCQGNPGKEQKACCRLLDAGAGITKLRERDTEKDRIVMYLYQTRLDMRQRIRVLLGCAKRNTPLRRWVDYPIWQMIAKYMWQFRFVVIKPKEKRKIKRTVL